MSNTELVDRNLKGKVAIVTAATDGIGRAIARRLGLEGVKVVVSSRKQENVDRTIKSFRNEGITVEGCVCHVAKADHRQQLVDLAIEKFGKIDILVSNAGMNLSFESLLDVSEEIWDKLFEVNVKAGFLLTKLVVPHMEKQKGSSIVYVSSLGGYAPRPAEKDKGVAAYFISKTTLIALTVAMSGTLVSKGIRVNCIAPGIIETRMGGMLLHHPDTTISGSVKTMIGMGRAGTPEECTGAVAFLVSDEASYITGETICIGGGINLRM